MSVSVLIGENSFEVDRAVAQIVAEFDGEAERIDGAEVEPTQLPDLFAGTSLFSESRLVIIKNLSEHKQSWEILPEWIERVSDSVQVVLVEHKPDKRTKTYKALQKFATVKEFKPWSERDSGKAEAWLLDEAKQRDIALTRAHAGRIVERVGVDQWALYHALEKVALLDDISIERIDEIIEQSPDESVFELLDTALRGDHGEIHRSIEGLRRTTDAYQTFGLLSSQISQLTLLSLTDRSAQEVAADTRLHPYGLSKLAHHAQRLTRTGTTRLIEMAAETDLLMKSTSHDPWRLVELLLIKIARS